MPALSYRQSGLTLQQGGGGSPPQVRDLQRSLRSLGYLKSGIDGAFGPGTTKAVRALQLDLLMNDGTSTSGDGSAPVRVKDFNLGRVTAVTGVVDQPLVESISDILDSPGFPTLPFAADPVAENKTIASQIAAMRSTTVPIPFLIAILRQESNLMHYHEPPPHDDDGYIVVGLDTNDPAHPERITSRGYGVGQYTLFHHPPTASEVNGIMLDINKNLQKAMSELREKFDRFVNGAASGRQADERLAEFGNGPLRLCKHSQGDPRYMKDCKQCGLDAGSENILSGVTPLYSGSHVTHQPTQYYASANYQSVPIRKHVGCDWPYAARRYNGSGMNSYHYQVRILKHLVSS